MREIYKFLQNGLLYKGVKPVMWSVVEKTALAEAEIEYQDHTSTTLWVKFPVIKSPKKNCRRQHRHLDDDAVDNPRQSRDCVWGF